MKQIAVWVMCGLFAMGPLQAQEYKVRTDETDSFSVALVKLLNCAINKFEDCRGDYIRTTWRMDEDYKLNFHFPGSAMAIVEHDVWDKDVYIEFRGFADKKSRDQGIRHLVAKIKKSLGNQLNDPHANDEDEEIYFYGLSIKDKNGFFSMNMELFGGSSSDSLFVLGADREDESKPKKDFVLLKIYGGIPAYHYFIGKVDAPEEKLDLTLRHMVKNAETDYDSMPVKKMDHSLMKRKGKDTINMNGIDVLMNYSGGVYSANLKFQAENDSASFRRQWLFYQQALQAALGSEYVFYVDSTFSPPRILYYREKNNNNRPRVNLELKSPRNKPSFILISIESGIHHPRKRGWDGEEDL